MPISDVLKQRWQLHNITRLREDLLAAESDRFGPVILKRSSDAEQLRREFDALSGFGTMACRVYALEEGVLLEERILPGISLREEPDLEKRLEVLMGAWESIHNPKEKGVTYQDWLAKACQVPCVPGFLRGMGEKARIFCEELFDKYPERILLHGDLHHDNLVLRSDGSYAVIDPKGVIGPRILDLPRFLLNEQPENVRPAMKILAERLGYSPEDLGKAYFLEAVLANLWLAEDGLPLLEDRLASAERILEEIYENQKS